MANLSVKHSFATALQQALQATVFLEDRLMEEIGAIDFDITASPFVSLEAEPQILVTSDRDVTAYLPVSIRSSFGDKKIDVPVHYSNNMRAPS
ncbi:MAG: hypothetical protein COB76_03050 [Alphaproteobacteria bacterium]|nr:MAG: hypothetical protein COB76_03050 [Alphaproteobacteria bacterium]